MIEDVRICINTNLDAMEEVEPQLLFQGNTPSLRSLVIFGLPLACPPDDLNNLSLFVYCPPPLQHGTRSINRILSTATNIETLALSLHRVNGNAGDLPTVNLPRLRRLILTFSPTHTVDNSLALKTLFDTLSVPELQTLNMGGSHILPFIHVKGNSISLSVLKTLSVKLTKLPLQDLRSALQSMENLRNLRLLRANDEVIKILVPEHDSIPLCPRLERLCVPTAYVYRSFFAISAISIAGLKELVESRSQHTRIAPLRILETSLADDIVSNPKIAPTFSGIQVISVDKHDLWWENETYH